MLKILVAALYVLIAIPLVPSTHAAEKVKITDADVSRLKPGDYIWEPSLAPDGRMSVVVNLHAQRASVYRDGVRIAATTVSSGKRGYPTPTGVFRIQAKYRVHRSKKYNNAPMPYTLRFARGGEALHAGGVPGYPSSHGCVHLPRTFAKLLFDEARLGTAVVVMSGKPAAPAATDQPLAVAARDTGSSSSGGGMVEASAE